MSVVQIDSQPNSRQADLSAYRDRLREQLRRHARTDSASFCAAYRDMVPGPQQRQMAARCDDPAILYQADFWPRDHGKSEIFVNAYPLRNICENPDIRILLVQKTALEARKSVLTARAELEQNEELRQSYADHWQRVTGQRDIVNKAGMVDDKTGAWQAQRFYVKRNRIGKDPTFEGVGVGGAITGGHFDLIICDDILDDENTKTPERCQSIINWFFGTILQLREPDTKIIVVGTLKTLLENLYSVFEDNPIWNMTVKSALLSHELDDIDYTPVTTVIDGQAQVTGVTVQTDGVETLWPERWPIEALLLDMLGSPRRIWRREKLNDLQAMAEQIFKKWMFRHYDHGDPPSYRRVVQSWDTAFKETRGAAYSAMSEWGEATAGAFLRDLYRDKLEWPELALAIPLMYLSAAIRPDAVLIEDKASGQSAIQEYSTGKDREVWLYELRRYIDQPGAKLGLVQLAEAMLARPGLPTIIRVPVVPIKVGGGSDKETRADDASVWYANGQVWHPERHGNLEAFEAELLAFPGGRYKDWTDTTSQAIIYLFGSEQNYASGKL